MNACDYLDAQLRTHKAHANKEAEAAAASLAEDIYLRIICEPAFEKWTLSSRAEFAKRAARIFYGIEK